MGLWNTRGTFLVSDLASCSFRLWEHILFGPHTQHWPGTRQGQHSGRGQFPRVLVPKDLRFYHNLQPQFLASWQFQRPLLGGHPSPIHQITVYTLAQAHLLSSVVGLVGLLELCSPPQFNVALKTVNYLPATCSLSSPYTPTYDTQYTGIWVLAEGLIDGELN